MLILSNQPALKFLFSRYLTMFSDRPAGIFVSSLPLFFFSPDFFQSQITGKAYHFLFSVLPSSDTFYYYCELSGATRV